RQRASYAGSEHALPADRRFACECSWHYGRFDAAYPPMDSDEQVSHYGLSRCVLYVHCFQCGRLPHANWRSAFVPGVSEGDTFLVGDGALLADVGGGSWLFVGCLLYHGRGELPPHACDGPVS